MGNLSFPLHFAVNPLPSYTYATLPAASSVAIGYKVRASDLGANGTELVSNGTRWVPIGGTAMLKSLAAAASGIANVETIALQAAIPTNAWQTNDAVRIYLSLTKNGTTDALNLAVRMGTAGTTADTAVITSVSMLSAANQTAGLILEFKLASATSVQRVGTPGVQPAYGGSSTTAAVAPVTISDASANPLFVTVTIASSGTTNTVGIQSGQIQLVTP